MANADKIVGDAIIAFVRSQLDGMRTDGGRSKAGRLLGTIVWEVVGCILIWTLLSLLHLQLAAVLWFLILGLIWLARRAAIVQRWVRGYRMTLAGDSLRYPGRRAAYWFWRAEVSHRAQLRKQWHAACATLGIKNAMKMTPPLNELRTLSNGDMTAVIHPGPLAVKGGVREVRAQRDDIAATCGCEGGIIVKPFGAGSGNQAASARLTFLWERKAWPVLPIQQLPSTPLDRVSIGNDADLHPVGIPLGMSTLLVAMTGMGKSQTMWALLVGIEQKVHSVLYAIDPKGGQELGKLRRLVNRTVGRRQYADYASDSDAGAYRVILAAERALKERQQALAERDVRKWLPTMADVFPLIVLVIDEVMEMLAKINTKDPVSKKAEAALVTLLSQGRAAGVMVIMSTQVSDKEVLGQNRTLIAVRIVLGTENPMQTGMAFGDAQAEANGALCSEIAEPGIAYVREEGVRGYRKVRIAYVDDEDVDAICETGMPDNMGDDGTDKVESWKPHWNYRYLSAKDIVIDGVPVPPGQLVYTGETNNPERRHAEHVRAFQAGRKDHAWMRYVDISKRPIITYAPSEAHAKKIETWEILNLLPTSNVKENQRNPWYGQPPVAAAPPKRHWLRRTRKAKVKPATAVMTPHRPAPAAYLAARRTPQDGYRPAPAAYLAARRTPQDGYRTRRVQPTLEESA